jgi:hypothetical protein
MSKWFFISRLNLDLKFVFNLWKWNKYKRISFIKLFILWHLYIFCEFLKILFRAISYIRLLFNYNNNKKCVFSWCNWRDVLYFLWNLIFVVVKWRNLFIRWSTSIPMWWQSCWHCCLSFVGKDTDYLTDYFNIL